MLRWTKELPTESGFYWVEIDYDQIQMVVEVVMDPKCWEYPIVWLPGETMPEEVKAECFVAWAGPIERPNNELD